MDFATGLKDRVYKDVVLTPFTQREYQVFEQAAIGHDIGEVARLLFIEESTVKTHLSNIRQKLKVDLNRRSNFRLCLCWVWMVFGDEIKQNIKGV